MSDEEVADSGGQGGRMTLGHLLMAMMFFMPIIAVTDEIKHAGGGVLRYSVGIPLALVVGGLIVRLNWTMGKFFWLRSQNVSKKLQNGIAIGIYTLDIIWTVVGCLAGNKLASLLIKHAGS